MRSSVAALLVGWALSGCHRELPCDTGAHCEDDSADPEPKGPGESPEPGTEDATEPGTTDTPGTDPFTKDADQDGWAVADGDCDDHDAAISPGAEEVCDGQDNDCSGFADDGLPNVLLQETDYAADGVVDSATRSTYDSSGRVVLREVDLDGDGIFETVESYTYTFDGLGRLVETATDLGDDGYVDTVKAYEYDANGLLVASTTDLDADGVPDRIDTYYYDAAGQRIGWDLDADGDGDVDTSYSYTYDPITGMLVGLELTRFDAEGNVTSVSIYAYEYTPFGRTYKTYVDLEGDGVFDTTTTYTYDDTGTVLILAEVDTGSDGVIDSATSYKYDELGELLVIEIDTGADASPDTRIVRTETC